MKRSALTSAVLALALTASACGSSDDEAADTTIADAMDQADDAMAMDDGDMDDPDHSSMDEMDMDDSDMDDSDMDDNSMDDMDEMDEMDMSAMEMGDASATRADAIDDAALASGDFVLLDTRPQGYDDAAGSAWIARHTNGTTVTIELSGLTPNTDFISHVHAEACSVNGGAHFQFEVGGTEMPPNEIHLAFTSDVDGNGVMTAENDQVAGMDAVAFVVHPADLIDNKIGCVDFVDVDPS